jgi:signal transduction histidine kinase
MAMMDAQAVRDAMASSRALLDQDPDASMQHADRALALLGDLGDPDLRAAVLQMVGSRRLRRGLTPETEAMILAAVDQARLTDDPRLLFDCVVTLGVMRSNQGQLSLATDAYTEALEVAKECMPDPGSLMILNNLGTLHARLRNYEAALECFVQVKAGVDKPHFKAISCLNVAEANFELGRLEEAQAGYAEAARYISPGSNEALRPHLLAGQARSYSALGMVPEALACLGTAIALHGRRGDVQGELQLRGQRAALMQELGRPQGAFSELNTCWDLARSLGLPEEERQVCENLVQVAEAQGHWETAYRALQRIRDLDRGLMDQDTQRAVEEASVRYQLEIHKLRTVDLARANAQLERANTALASLNMGLKEARDRAERADRAKTSFLANLSHEIRTPLNGVIGLTDRLLLSEDLPPDHDETLRVIRDSGALTLSVIGQVLDFSRLEVGHLELDPVAFSPLAAVRRTVALVEPQALARGLNLDLTVPADVPQLVLADDLRMRQILLNLLSNAIKFTDQGGVSVDVTWRRDRLQVQVHDTGVGIADHVGQSIFEMFAQATPGTTRTHGGTGLGLTIARGLARAMGGELNYESTAGEGSRFWFVISAPATEEPTAPPADVAPIAGRGRRVLVVDDEPLNLEVAEGLLGHLGFDVHVAPGGAEALAMCAAESYDLLFLDCHMPALDGYQVARRLRDAGWTGPILALTANVLAGNEKRCTDAGMDGLLAKPVTLARLRETLKRWLPPE